MTLTIDRPITRPVESAPAPKTPADLLRHAAMILEETGWCRRVHVDEAGRRCLAGAIHAANGQFGNHPGWDDHSLKAIGFVRRVLENTGQEWWLLPAHWNDMCARDGAEVIGVLRAAANLADD